MKLIHVSLRNVRVRLLSSTLTMVSIALGTALLASLWLLLDETERKYQANVRGYGVVVGPKEGSGLDLVLSTVFNFTELAPPTGLLPLSVYEELHSGKLRRKFAVRYAIPQCRGDNIAGFPIIGTTDEMFSKFSRGELGKDADGNTIPELIEFAEGRGFEFSHDDLMAFAEQVAGGEDSHEGHLHAPGEGHDHEGEGEDPHAGHLHAPGEGHEGEGHGHEHEGEGEDPHAGHLHAPGEGHEGEGHGHEHEGEGEDPHAGHLHAPGEGHEHEEPVAEEHVHADGSHDDHAHGPALPLAWRQAVIGAAVAARTGLRLGDHITPVHGVADDVSAHRHEEAQCEIVGVMAATGTPLDRSVFVPIGMFLSMAKHDAIRESQGAEAGNVGLSSIIVDTVRPTQFGQRLRYEFQTRPDAQAVVPWFEVNRLLAVVGDASQILRVISYLVLAVAAVSILVALYNTMNERRREIAIMRSLGARRRQIIAVILQEAVLVSLVGGILGVAGAHAAAFFFADRVEDVTGIALDWAAFSDLELFLILGVAVLGGLAGMLPAFKGSRTQVAEYLGPTS